MRHEPKIFLGKWNVRTVNFMVELLNCVIRPLNLGFNGFPWIRWCFFQGWINLQFTVNVSRRELEIYFTKYVDIWSDLPTKPNFLSNLNYINSCQKPVSLCWHETPKETYFPG